MDDLRALPADRFLTWQNAGRVRGARKQPPRKLGPSPFLAAVGALALGFGLAVAPPQSIEASPLTIGGKPKNSVSAAQQAALDSFAGAPSLAAAQGVRIGTAYGPDDEDCIRADAELICRR